MACGDIIYDKPNNELIKIECIKYKACISIIGAIQGTSKESFYQELGLESIRDKCRFRKLTFFKRLCKVFLRNISLST